ncbi:DUF4179 domain-containing protein [Kocuria sp.]|uniref:DUF4179 domain-containing protein n=1 Tax=Kocuria sp. TaxID=1871328 RepID=UPI0026E00293|nr:DUF4179 domain-containing protein [Kocuria sp.]MDO5618045.1 DUF4179 domain-containing protein [Kocuria sp.]
MNIAARKKVKMAGLCAAVVAATLSVTGCSYINPQATTMAYSPGDGIVEEMDQVSLNNILIVAESENDPGRLLGTVVNKTDEDLTLTVTTDQASAEIEVPANGETRLEDSDNETLLDPAGAQPGLMVETTFDTGSTELTKSVPILDHTFPRYAEYIPGGAPATPANPSNTPGAAQEGSGH